MKAICDLVKVLRPEVDLRVRTTWSCLPPPYRGWLVTLSDDRTGNIVWPETRETYCETEKEALRAARSFLLNEVNQEISAIDKRRAVLFAVMGEVL
jgi:hypothetical protein